MNDIKRIFWLVLDSFGIGGAEDAADFGDAGSNTLKSLLESGELHVPNMTELGLFNIDGIAGKERAVATPKACFARLAEASKGKDTTIGHWEMAGIITEKALPLYPNGFPDDLMEMLTRAIDRPLLCNRPYSGTQVINDFGQHHLDTGALIVYTSADSICQIAAHEEKISLDELYRCCEIARGIFSGEHGVARIIARPFIGTYSNFKRTTNRRDFSLAPPQKTGLDKLLAAGLDVIGVGKIHDIFTGQGITRCIKTTGNMDGMDKTLALMEEPFQGLAFINLVDFDMLFGHRNDVLGYTAAMNAFDVQLSEFLERMDANDLLIVTADHGCDPGFPGTDHTREEVPLLLYAKSMQQGRNLGKRHCFADIGATVLDALGVSKGELAGESMWSFVKEK